jgi:3-isopropylmalate/(R)-2-methylmalate dehydratase small subunit
MQAFTHLRALAAPLEGRNVDTDQIIPARFLKKNRDEFYKNYLFHDLRFDEHGAPRPDFILNRPPFQGAQILVADENFGCGSSREGAVYCLADYGIRAILAPSFGDIFFNNCFKNGLLPIRLTETEVDQLFNEVKAFPSFKLVVDLEKQTVSTSNSSSVFHFEVDAFRKHCLINGLDDIGLTLQHADAIHTFEERHISRFPWLANTI